MRDDDTLVTIATFDTVWEASMARGVLESAGIRAVEHCTILPPWAPPAVCAALQLGQEGSNEKPLVVGEVTGMRSSRKGHRGQNGPVAIWLSAPTPQSVASSAFSASYPC